jgi:hypothetical protein
MKVSYDKEVDAAYICSFGNGGMGALRGDFEVERSIQKGNYNVMDREYNIRIEPQVYERLEAESRAEHRDISEIANDVLRRHNLKKTMERLRQVIEPQARGIGWNSDEDVFRDIS